MNEDILSAILARFSYLYVAANERANAALKELNALKQSNAPERGEAERGPGDQHPAE